MRRKYLLVMPRVAVKIGVKYSFPIGIAYLSAVMKREGFAVRTLNPNHTEESLEAILTREIIDNDIDVILTGGLSGQYNSVKNVIETAKGIKPDIIAIVGGGLVSAEPDIAMQALEYADFGVVGEGEVTVVELCRALEDTTVPLEDVLGVVRKGPNGWLVNEPRPEIEDLDSLPFPDYDGFDMEGYLKLPPAVFSGVDGDKTFFCLSARSCPYQCTFCFHTLGRKYRMRSIENVIDEIRFLHDTYGVKQIVLEDELFASSKERVKIFSDHLSAMDISWFGTFRIDQIDEELLRILKNSTCRQMFFGLESVNNNILKSMRKNLTIETIEKNLKLVYDAEIPFGGNLLFGDAEDTLETCRNNLSWYAAHPEYNLSLVNIMVYPGTELYREAVRKGIIQDRVQFLQDGCPVINVSKMSDSEYAVIQQEILCAAKGFPLNDQKLHAFPAKTKHATISGCCRRCGVEIIADDILFLTTDYSYIYCRKCGAKHRADLPEEARENLLTNLQAILDRKQKIAIWGIQPYTWDMFNDFSIFENELITFIDNSQGKQFLKVTKREKRVFSPQVLLEEEFDMVIFCYPHLFLSYTDLVKSQYPKVHAFVDVLDLMCFPD